MTDKKENGEKSSHGPGYLEVILIAVLMATAVAVIYDRYFAIKINTVDMAGFFRQQKALVAAGELTTDQWKKNLDNVDEQIEKTAKSPNQIVLLKEVVLKNGKEIRLTP